MREDVTLVSSYFIVWDNAQRSKKNVPSSAVQITFFVSFANGDNHENMSENISVHSI